MPASPPDFIAGLPGYGDDPQKRGRMAARWHLLVGPVAADIAGRTVLDLAAHDGRWAYAFAQAGAAHVTAVEARPALLATFSDFPDDQIRSRVSCVADDVFAFLERVVAAGEQYDVVAVLGFLYHTMDHYRLFVLIRKLGPALIIVDGEFITSDNAIVQVLQERTEGALTAIAQFEGQQKTLVGVPSTGLMQRIAGVLDYDLHWADPETLPGDLRPFAGDYFRGGRKSRRACYLVKPGG